MCHLAPKSGVLQRVEGVKLAAALDKKTLSSQGLFDIDGLERTVSMAAEKLLDGFDFVDEGELISLGETFYTIPRGRLCNGKPSDIAAGPQETRRCVQSVDIYHGSESEAGPIQEAICGDDQECRLCVDPIGRPDRVHSTTRVSFSADLLFEKCCG